MAYSQIEQSTLDLDLFFKDKNKYIHIASGGGRIPDILANSDNTIEEFKTILNDFKETFEIDVNPSLMEFLDIEENKLELYLESFIKYAKKGFFTYDKTNLGEFNDMTFHLVAKPIKGKLELNKKYDFVNSENILPEEFKPFVLTKFMK